MFVAQLERKKEVNTAFFYEFMVDEEGRLVRVFGQMLHAGKTIVFLVMWFR
jgi:hypothetical protein